MKSLKKCVTVLSLSLSLTACVTTAEINREAAQSYRAVVHDAS